MPTVNGNCSYCRKTGHKRKDSRKWIFDEKNRTGANSLDTSSAAGLGSLETYDEDGHVFGTQANPPRHNSPRWQLGWGHDSGHGRACGAVAVAAQDTHEERKSHTILGAHWNS